MPIKLKSLIKESRQDIVGLAEYLDKKIKEFKDIRIGSERSIFLAHLTQFWDDKVLRWNKYVNLRGHELDPEEEEELKNEILDWIVRINKEIEALKK